MAKMNRSEMIRRVLATHGVDAPASTVIGLVYDRYNTEVTTALVYNQKARMREQRKQASAAGRQAAAAAKAPKAAKAPPMPQQYQAMGAVPPTPEAVQLGAIEAIHRANAVDAIPSATGPLSFVEAVQRTRALAEQLGGMATLHDLSSALL